MDSIGLLRSDLNPSSGLPSPAPMTRPDYWLTKISKLRIDRAHGDTAATPAIPPRPSCCYLRDIT